MMSVLSLTPWLASAPYRCVSASCHEAAQEAERRRAEQKQAAEEEELVNAAVYSSFGAEVAAIVADEDAFRVFKSRLRFPVWWGVIFGVWTHELTHGDFVPMVLASLHAREPQLLEHLPRLAAADRAVGAPETTRIDVPVAGGMASVETSPLIPRYLYELSLVHETFGAGLGGLRLLEIGGGYGGFAAAMLSVHPDAASYSIVDLRAVGELTSLCWAASAGHLFAGQVPPKLTHLAAASTANVSSDLLLSFYSISEQKRATVDAYLRRYVAHAARGYLQLNMDEDLRRGGAAAHSMDDANHDRYNVLSLFKGVWQVQPSAVLLPPPPGTAGTPLHHHRIVWGPRARA